MDAMGLERAVVVGHSMGAMVSQRLIVDHPQRVSRVVLMGAFATIHGNPAVDEFVTSAIVPLVDPIAPDFAREWQLSTLASPIDPAIPRHRGRRDAEGAGAGVAPDVRGVPGDA